MPDLEAPTRLRVLIVDDEPKNLTALESILEADDRELVRAESGFEALKCLLDGDFALILLDVHMPGMDGFETAELIRERDRSRQTPIIFLTAAVRGEFAMAKGYGLGAVDYIVKPVDAEILRFKVAVFADLFRKTAEAERQARELLAAHALLTGVLDGATETTIAALDDEGRILVWNEGGRRLYGHRAESIVGQHVGILFAPAEANEPPIAALFEHADQYGVARQDTRHRRADGRVFPARVTLTRRVASDGTPAGYVFITVDTSERQTAQKTQQLLAEERSSRFLVEREHERLRQLLNLLPEPVVLTDESGHIERLNAAARELFGDIEVGESLIDAPRLGPWLRLQPDGEPFPAQGRPLDRALLNGEVVIDEQELLRNPETGAERHVLANVAPVLDANGTVVGAALALRDISALKDLERQKDEFLAAISHDLRSPLTIISGTAQLLLRRMSRLDPDGATSLREFLVSIDRTSKRAAGMVNQLLDVSRMQMNRPLQLELAPTDLNALVQAAAIDLRTATNRHRIVVEIEETPITGDWDRARLERVAINLIENAIKYSPGGGEITVRVWRQEHDDGHVDAHLSVTDTGVGIAADEVSQVFDRFYRARNVIGKVEGSGIGLAAAKKIVAEHGGEIVLESQEGVGTTVTVRLPLAIVSAGARR